MVPQLIGFIDADCFYVSCERKRSPELRGRPVGVLGNQNACVIAASYELKKLGVKVGTLAREAEQLCPGVVLKRRDFQWYGAVSGQLRDLLQQISPAVEYYSVDEFFFDASDLVRTLGAKDEADAAAKLRALIWDKLEVAVSVGLAPSRTLAKLACKQGKPNGQEAWVDLDETWRRLEQLPIDAIAGIAKGRCRRLERLGLTTCGQFRRADRHVIRDVLTIDGEAFWYELNGESVRPIRTTLKPRKSLLRGGSVRQPTLDVDTLWAWVVRNNERVVGALIREHRRCRRIGLSLDFRALGSVYRRDGSAQQEKRNGRAWSASLSLDRETRSAGVIVPALWELFQTGLAFGRRHVLDPEGRPAPVSRVHVAALELVPDESRQLSLFETADSDHVDVLRETINHQTKRFAVRSASTLPLTDVYSDPHSDYDISDIAGKVCF